jgi:hypothetical protein
MGDVSARNSIIGILAKHERDLKAWLRKRYPSKLIRRFDLSDDAYAVVVRAELTDGTIVELAPFDIDRLGEEFPDCEVGY